MRETMTNQYVEGYSDSFRNFVIHMDKAVQTYDIKTTKGLVQVWNSIIAYMYTQKEHIDEMNRVAEEAMFPMSMDAIYSEPVEEPIQVTVIVNKGGM